MPIELKISANTAYELDMELLALGYAKVPGGEPREVIAQEADDTPVPFATPATSAPPAEPPVKRKPGRPRKSADPAPPPGAENVPVVGPLLLDEAPMKHDEPVTLERARAALFELRRTQSLEKCQDVLGHFGATKMSDVKPEQYEEFYAMCITEVQKAVTG